MILLKFELKRPQIFVEPKKYGEYLMENPKATPRDGIPLETEGYTITGLGYGDAEITRLPFKVGDWIDAEYIKNNFNEIDS